MYIVGERGIRGFDGTPGMPGENSRPAPKGEKGKLRKICVLRRFSTYPLNRLRKKKRLVLIINLPILHFTFLMIGRTNLME